jgi:hypothetical protein
VSLATIFKVVNGLKYLMELGMHRDKQLHCFNHGLELTTYLFEAWLTLAARNDGQFDAISDVRKNRISYDGLAHVKNKVKRTRRGTPAKANNPDPCRFSTRVPERLPI